MATKKSSGRNSLDRSVLSQIVVDAATEKLAEHAAKHADKVKAKAAKHVEGLERLAAHLDALDVWTRVEPTPRRPRFTREQIAAAAVRIADVEGIDALSMRRLAAELDAGTMTLYHYVRTKDELLTLVFDTIMGEVVLPAGRRLPADWRDAMVEIATRSRDSLRRHPWILQINDDPPIGPNSVRHFDQSMQAATSFPGTLQDRLDLIMAVDEYVFGFCTHERNNLTDGELIFDDPTVAYVGDLITTGEYPSLSALTTEHGLDTVWTSIHHHARDTGRFERNLRRLLAGFLPGLPHHPA